MNLHVHICDVEGKPAVCFDTGLDPRSFARTKMSQSLIEPGYIVSPDGTHKVWKSTGVNDEKGLMRVWGEYFEGERLDALLNAVNNPAQKAAEQAALKAVTSWIRAKLLLGEVESTLHPAATFVNIENGKVFFSPENLAQRCLVVEREDLNRYSCPDLFGTEASAFCAGAMLYKILAKAYPYPDNNVIFQDMREGIFLPPRLAIPGLDEKLCGLIHCALMLPVAKKKINISGTDILSGLLEILDKQIKRDASSPHALIQKLPEAESRRIIKRGKRFLFRQNLFVSTRRFAVQNKPVLIGAAAVLLFVAFVSATMTKTRNERLSTAGMASDSVVRTYYDFFSSLDHMNMEAFLLGADKSDVNVAANFTAINKARQAYGNSPNATLFSARFWKENGGELPAPNVFGVTDLTLERLEGTEDDNLIVYSAHYLLWYPGEELPSDRTDVLTLKRHRGNWRITEINRTLN